MRHGLPLAVGLLAALLAASAATAATAAAPVAPAAPAAPSAPVAGQSPVGDAALACSARVASTVAVVLDCSPGFATAHDRIVVYPRAGVDVQHAAGDQLDMHDAIWLFEPGAGGRVALIIDFRPGPDGTLVADLYDDRDGDGVVAHVMVGSLPLPIENRGRPTITVTSRDGWWSRDGQVSFNLDITVDGPVRATFFSTNYLHLLEADGTPNYVIHVRDANGDSRPELEWRQFYPPLSEDIYLEAHYRTEITFNPQDDEVPIEAGLFWPYLAAQPRLWQAGEYIKEYNASPPPIEVDWASGRIVQLGEFVASRGNPGSCFIYSVTRVIEGRHNETNFENPFCFYDLAGAGDGWPDMSIRFERTLPAEVPQLRLREPITIIEYSWDQQRDHNWTYALNLVGQPPLERRIEFPDFSVAAVPPAELPGWVAEQEWAAATFVEIDPPYWTSEHVYEYTVEEGDKVLLRYLAGLDQEPPTDAFSRVPVGFRGQYAFHLDGPARLYISPIDGRLHLLAAEAGRWNMGGGREVHYASRDGRHVDSWTVYQDGRLLTQLHVVGDRLVYASGGGIFLGRLAEAAAAIPSALVAPRDGTEWADLRRMLAEARREAAPDDLRALFRAAALDIEWLPNASLRDLRLTDDGFRFVASLAAVPTTARWAAGVAAGEYAVDYDRATGFRLAPLVPAELAVTAPALLGGPARAGELAKVQVTIRNPAPVDAQAVAVELRAGRTGDDMSTVGTLRLAVPGGAAMAATFDWLPADGGEWLLQAALPASAGPSLSTSVMDAPSSGRAELAARSELPPLLPVATLLLLAAAALGAAVLGAALLGLRHFTPALALRQVGRPVGPVWVTAEPIRRRAPAVALPWLAYAVAIPLAELLARLADPALGASAYFGLLVVALHAAARADGLRSALLVAFAIVALARLLALTLPVATLDPSVAHLAVALPLALALAIAIRLVPFSRVDLGLVLTRRAVALAGVLAPAALVAGVLIAGATGERAPLPAAVPEQLLAQALAALLAIALVEELVMRGLLQATAVRALGPAAGVALGALVFALIAASAWSPLSLVVTLAVGLVLGTAVLLTRSILPAVAARGGLVLGLMFVAPFLPAAAP